MPSDSSASAGGSRAYWGVLLAVLLLAGVLRVYGLGNLPPGFFCDEAGLGYNAYSILETGRGENGEFLPLYFWSFGVSYKNPVFIYAATIPVALFGLSEFSVRLTAAVFGVLGVLGVALLGRALLGRAGGLLAAIFLALSPWHIHFSRIAFELIAFPALFLFATAAFVGGLRRPRLFVRAAVLYGLCLYTYGPAKLFVPAFVAGAVVLHRRRLWEVRGALVAPVIVGLLTAAPLVMFDLQHVESRQYLRQTTMVDTAKTFSENLDRFLVHYSYFFSPAFLFTAGDPLVRHAVPGFGELPLALAPLLLLGLVWTLQPKHPNGKLLLWWLFLYPIAASLMNEIPSASRSIIGVPAFCLLAAAGAAGAARVLSRGTYGRAVVALAAGVLVGALAVGTWRYWSAYSTRYRAEAAADFQYGYRETVQFMEERRSSYDLLLLTANNVNQPQIFTAFYTAVDPYRWQATENAGYLILDPAEYGRYEVRKPILAAVRDYDLYLFGDYQELHRVVTPAGNVEFVIIEARTRNRFLTDWLVLGPFENPHGTGIGIDYVTPGAVAQRAYTGSLGDAYWRRIQPPFVRVDMNLFFGETLRKAGRPPEWLCAYALSQVRTSEARPAALALRGPSIAARVWLNGKPITSDTITLPPDGSSWPIRLEPGENELMVKVCKTTEEWYFTARLTDAAGRDLEGVEVRPAFSSSRVAVAPARSTARQLVDGFGRALHAAQSSELYADYRGDSAAWFERLEDPNGAIVWETDACPEKVPTVFAFTAVVGDERGRAELWVNGRYALTFETGGFSTAQSWGRGAYRMEFAPRSQGQGLSGYWLVHVPEEDVTAGKPVELRVAHSDGSPHAFFMLKDRHDTIAHESLTLERIIGAEGPRQAAPPIGSPENG